MLPYFQIYFKNVHPNHPDGGKMTQNLENMKTGDTILFQGPSGCPFYHGSGPGGGLPGTSGWEEGDPYSRHIVLENSSDLSHVGFMQSLTHPLCEIVSIIKAWE